MDPDCASETTVAAYRVTFIDAAVGSVEFFLPFLFHLDDLYRQVDYASSHLSRCFKWAWWLLSYCYRELEGMQFVLISSIFPAVLFDGALSLWEWEKLEVLHHRWCEEVEVTHIILLHLLSSTGSQQFSINSISLLEVMAEGLEHGWGRLTVKSSNSMSFWLQDDVSWVEA